MTIIRLSEPLPANEPVTLAEAKQHLYEDPSDNSRDSMIAGMIAAARDYAENYCGRAWAYASYALRLDAFPCGGIALPPDVRVVTAITYLDSSGAVAALDEQDWELDAECRRLRPVGAWPSGTRVRVEFMAGYQPAGSPATAVPASVVAAIKLVLADLYENREAQTTGELKVNPAVANLLHPYRVGLGV